MKKTNGASTMLAKTNIGGNEYLRMRLAPKPGDPLYLHLSDLLLGLKLVTGTEQSTRILDYGCGGSPYRDLFPNRCYHRADFKGFPDLDYEFVEDSLISAPDAAYDLILSTQVLEHVRKPALYLGECHRLLSPGGRLLLSTHGSFEDHGCPYDYQRWTADGLQLAIEDAGLRVVSVRKLTCGPRALLFSARMLQHVLISSDRTPAGWLLRIFQNILRRYPSAVDAFCDRAFPHSDRVQQVKPGLIGSTVYVALLIEAERPAQ